MFKNKANRYFKSMVEWLRPDLPGIEPLTIQSAKMLTNRNRFSELLTYRGIDEKTGLMFLDEGDKLAVGFSLCVTPLMVAGLDAETQIEAIINSCPSDTIIQFGALASPQVEAFLDTWAKARLEQNSNELLQQIAENRHAFMMSTAFGPSMLPKSKMHPRMHQWYIHVRLPFKGDLASESDRANIIKLATDLRNTVIGNCRGMMINAAVCDETEFKVLMREILAPHINASERIKSINPDAPLTSDLMDKRTRISMNEDGFINFSEKGGKSDVCVVPITVDSYPREWALPAMCDTLGDPAAWDERITAPYYAYTTIHVLDGDRARDEMVGKMGALSKQTMSESPWFRSMMTHLYERKDMVQEVLDETRKGHRIVRAYTGINVYCQPNEARAQAEYVKGLWRKRGFRVSEERFIALPVFIASLPLQYNPMMDEPNRGLQRAQRMHSLNASSLVHICGDWRGTDPAGGGPLFVSRKGQLACFNVFESSTNYNFTVTASSGAGKSFVTAELLGDILSRNGLARVFDVGRSYFRFCELMGGENIVFSPDNPMSLNPFTDIRTEQDLAEMLPMIKDMLRQMAFPTQPEELTDQWQYAAIEDAVVSAWTKHNENADLESVYNELMESSDSRANDVGFQLKPFAIGRYRKWFTGRRTVQLSNQLCIIELEELNQDPQLQACVLIMMMFYVSKEMYLAEFSRPKMMIVDEAWSLMGAGQMKTGRFIETLFRRCRKVNGSAGIVTQSYEDYEKSPAAKAALENAEWQFTLYQRAESIDFAIRNKRIVGDEQLINLIKSVKSGDGFSEIYIKNSAGSGLYRFITDKHSYYTYTTNPKDRNKISQLTSSGKSLKEAIHICAMADYEKMWGPELTEQLFKR